MWHSESIRMFGSPSAVLLEEKSYAFYFRCIKSVRTSNIRDLFISSVLTSSHAFWWVSILSTILFWVGTKIMHILLHVFICYCKTFDLCWSSSGYIYVVGSKRFRTKWKMLWGIYNAIYELLVHRCEKCAEIKEDYVEKKQNCFISVTLKTCSDRKLLDPTAYVSRKKG